MKSRTIYIFAALFSVVFFFVMIKMTPPMGPDEAVVIACLMFILFILFANFIANRRHHNNATEIFGPIFFWLDGHRLDWPRDGS